MQRQNPYGPQTEYRFAFDRSTFGAFVAGLGLVGLLLFAAGTMLGGRGTGKAKPQRIAIGPNDLVACRQLVADADFLQRPVAVAQEPTPEPILQLPIQAIAQPPAPEAMEVAATENSQEGPTIFELQLGFYLRKSDADAFRTEITQRGYEPYIVPVQNSQQEIRYTVRIGTYPDLQTALEAANAFSSRNGGMDTVVRYRTPKVNPPETSRAATIGLSSLQPKNTARAT
jgi:rare lipoprotein A